MTLTDYLAWYAAIGVTLVLITGGWKIITGWFQKKVAAAAAASAGNTSA